MISWREHSVALSILGAALAACIGFFLTYRVQYESRIREVENARTAAEAKLQQARSEHASALQHLAAYKKIQADLDTIYNERWSTPEVRLTKMIGEVKRLAIASQLVPQSYGYTHTEDKKDTKVASVETATVGITFTVQGKYEQVRRLINLLELSPQFVIIDGIGLNGSAPGDQSLSFSLRLKPLFRVTSDAAFPPRAANVPM